MTSPAVASSPFDALAAGYDADFTATAVGSRLRRAVQARLEAVLRSKQRILELGCGTGEDALFLARQGAQVTGLDASEAMLAEARRKVRAAGLESRVTLEQRPLEALGSRPEEPPFDGAFSNFGALNCVADLPALAAALAPRLRPGAPLLLCVMGPVVPWEWLWYLGHGQAGRALRRLRRGGSPWRGLTVRYPSPGRLARGFAPAFGRRRLSAIGALLPPPYAEAWAHRHPRLLDLLDRWERRLERCPPLPWLADHYLLELERR